MAKKRVLIIDDEKDFTQMVKLNLEKGGKFEVFIENKSPHALAAAKRYVPDVILLDILMPEMDGFKVLELLKKDYNTISIPVVMLTAVMTDEAKAKSTSLYDEGYIEKPVTAEDLEREIEKVLRIRDSAKE